MGSNSLHVLFDRIGVNSTRNVAYLIVINDHEMIGVTTNFRRFAI